MTNKKYKINIQLVDKLLLSELLYRDLSIFEKDEEILQLKIIYHREDDPDVFEWNLYKSYIQVKELILNVKIF
jgi:hypothetical protein